MKHMSLYLKLTLAFIILAITTAALIAVFIRATSADRLFQFVEEQQRTSMEEILVSYYAVNQSWDGVAGQWALIERITAPENDPAVQSGEAPVPGTYYNPNKHYRRFRFGLADLNGVVLVSVDPNYPTGTILSEKMLKDGYALKVDGARVGTILTDENDPGLNPAEAQFLERTNQALLLSMAAALVIALLAGVLLARTLTRPLNALTTAAQKIAAGELEQQVKVGSNDEIGQLATAFNRMSSEVARSNQLRRQMTADIAHDLRTPLTVIAGYVESMRDGVLRPTTQRFDLMYSEIERLQNLVGDLRMLTQADAGELRLNPQPIVPSIILEHAAELFEHRAGQQDVNLSVASAPALPAIPVDEARLMQVMDNLISNALRYTPPGGSITLAAQPHPDGVEISVADTGTGIPKEELEHVFDRFHRVDKSRHSESSESGLGLAIVKALVEAHHGHVYAESSGQGMGTIVRMVLPAAPVANF